MSSASRGARAAARYLRQPARVHSRRYASHGEEHGHGHGSGPSAYDAPSGATGNEGFGLGFYLSLAAFPLFYVSYQIATNDNNFVSRFVEGYSSAKDKVEGKHNNLHDSMIQQAVDDRFLLKATPRGEAGPPVRYLEGLNAGSPLNVAAGQGSTDLSAVIKHQLEQREKEEEVRIARLRQ